MSVTATERERLAELLREKSYQRREVTLASGRKSNFYFDGKQTALHAEGAYLIGRLLWDAIDRSGVKVEAVGGLTLGADPLATAVSLASFQAGKAVPAFIVRKEPKGHGTGQWVEGRKNIPAGSTVVILEDVVTTGGSALKAVERVREEGLEVSLIAAVIDRQEGGRETIEAAGLKLISLFTKAEFHQGE
jgi:orotate phosphoribosyltransferase